MMEKPTLAFYDFACCEGCQLQVANMGEALIDVLEHFNLVEFREVMSEKHDGRVSIAVIEGSITDKRAEERIKKIRANSDILIAYGSCAVLGGINSIRNSHAPEKSLRDVYGDKADMFDTGKAMPVEEYVRVDYRVRGCPIYPPEFLSVLKSILTDLPFPEPDNAVCVECKFNENPCFYDKGLSCMGPVTRGGCGSWCVNNGNICYGCRGLVSNPNEKGAQDVMIKHNLTPERIGDLFRLYNNKGE